MQLNSKNVYGVWVYVLFIDQCQVIKYDVMCALLFSTLELSRGLGTRASTLLMQRFSCCTVVIDLCIFSGDASSIESVR